MKAPRSWPNSSRLEQLLGQRGAVDGDERALAPRATSVWMARATSSLPVPVSPVTSTVASALGGALDDAEQALHRLGAADHLAQAIGGARRAARARGGSAAAARSARVDRGRTPPRW